MKADNGVEEVSCLSYLADKQGLIERLKEGNQLFMGSKDE